MKRDQSRPSGQAPLLRLPTCIPSSLFKAGHLQSPGGFDLGRYLKAQQLAVAAIVRSNAVKPPAFKPRKHPQTYQAEASPSMTQPPPCQQPINPTATSCIAEVNLALEVGTLHGFSRTRLGQPVSPPTFPRPPTHLGFLLDFINTILSLQL